MTSSSPLVSALIPAYNAARTVRASVDSVLTQTVEDLEVIVVDDGSSDKTADVVDAITDSRVRLVRQPNGGAAAARNTALSLARGRWVALLDADDLWLPKKLERQLAVLDANPNTTAVQSGVYYVDDLLKVLQVRPCREDQSTLLDFLCFRNLPGAQSTWLISRRDFQRFGEFDPELVILEDWDISLKAARYCNPISIADPLTMVRVHAGNRSRDLDIHVAPGFRVLGKLFSDPELMPDVRAREREIYARFFTMLCGGAFRVRQWRDCAYWGARAVRTDPRMLVYMAALPVRRLRGRSYRAAGMQTSDMTDGRSLLSESVAAGV
jgi:glycosyltransferase involved in cell wall biosynthesis